VGHGDRQRDGVPHRPRVRPPGPGEIEGGAVTWRRADERQTERHVHRPVPREELDGDQRLVVVHRDDRVVLAARRPREHGIRRPRPRELSWNPRGKAPDEGGEAAKARLLRGIRLAP